MKITEDSKGMKVEFGAELSIVLKQLSDTYGINAKEASCLGIADFITRVLEGSGVCALRKQVGPRYINRKSKGVESRLLYLGKLLIAWRKALKCEDGYELVEEKTGMIMRPIHSFDDLKGAKERRLVMDSFWVVKKDGKIL